MSAAASQTPQTITVGPIGHPTLQFDHLQICEAVAAASDGDTIVVTPLAYDISTGAPVVALEDPDATIFSFDAFDLGLKNLTIRRADLLDIDGDGTVDEFDHPAQVSNGTAGSQCTGTFASFAAITIAGGQDASTVIEGLTIRDAQNFTATNGLPGGRGAGLFVGGGSSPSITDCHFLNNDAELGGAAYIDGASPTFNQCRFEDNTAIADALDGFGGAVYCSGSESLFFECDFEGNSAVRGGGIYDTQSSIIVRTSDLISNEAGDGGAGASEASNPLYENCFFTLNRAQSTEPGTSSDGGALWLRESTTVVRDSQFDQNWCTDLGGAVFINVVGEGHLVSVLDRNVFTMNGFDAVEDRTASGGGLFVEGQVDVRASQCEFRDNRATMFGGGVACAGSEDSTAAPIVILDYCQMVGNSANRGGGLSWDTVKDAELKNSLLELNRAFEAGGGAYVVDALGGSCDEVMKDINGDGIDELVVCCDGTPPVFHNVLVVDNSADGFFAGLGGGLYVQDAPLDIDSCTIVGNFADSFAGGIYFANLGLSQFSPLARLRASIIWENSCTVGAFCPSSPPVPNAPPVRWEEQVGWSSAIVADLGLEFEVDSVDWEGFDDILNCMPACPGCIDDDPLFVSGASAPMIPGQPNVAYYLSRDGDPLGESPCVNRVNLNDLLAHGLGTTAVDQTADAFTSGPFGEFDMGFHYRGPTAPPYYAGITASTDRITVEDAINNGFATVTFTLEADPYVPTNQNSLQSFLFLGSVSGTSPGIPSILGSTENPFMPVRFDDWTQAMLNGVLVNAYVRNALSPVWLINDLDETMTTLVGDGVEEVTLQLDATQMQALVDDGVTSIWHAFVVWDLFDGLATPVPNVTGASRVIEIVIAEM